MILLIDNYDSFSYNLVQMAGSIHPQIRVIRNDEMSVNEIRNLAPSHIILSPGPGYPKDAGVCEDVVRELKDFCPILGVCLGHQGICEVFGALICRAQKLMHGKKSDIAIDNTDPLFAGLPKVIGAARYHSLIARRDTLPPELKVIGEADNAEVMAVKHRRHCIYGLQFHPESILTPEGAVILKNFLNM